MKPSLILLGLLASTTALAEDGLAIHFTIKKTVGSSVSTYSDGVLMRTTEASSFEFPKRYALTLESRATDHNEVNIVATLKDLSSGKAVYAGSNAVSLKVGASANLRLHQVDQALAKYEIRFDTAYAPLPAAAKAR